MFMIFIPNLIPVFSQQGENLPMFSSSKQNYLLKSQQIQSQDIFLAFIEQGGDDFSSASPIIQIPCSANGNTCGYEDDYDEACPYEGAIAPDVVYSFTPPYDTAIDVFLCGSLYDTKLLIYRNSEDTLVGCNDDDCGEDGFKSQLLSLPVLCGKTYYIVVDGYGEECGDYVLQVNYSVQAPSNDICINAENMTGPYPMQVNGTTEGAMVDCPLEFNWNGIWYEIDLLYSSNDVTVEICGTELINDAGIILTADCSCDAASIIYPDSAGFQNPPECVEMKFNSVCGPGSVFLPLYLNPQMGFTLNVYVEDVCPMPENMTFIQTDPDTVDVSWEQPCISVISWELEYVPQDSTPSGLPDITGIISNFYKLADLSAGVCYDFYIRARCSENDVSHWQGPFTYCTFCEAISDFPYIGNFDNQPTAGNNSDVCIPDGTVPLIDCWINSTGDDIDWSVSAAAGSTLSSGTGPDADHTTWLRGNGKFLFTEASGCNVQTAILYTPSFDLTGLSSACLSFWYHMYGTSMGSLSVEVSMDFGTTWSSALWTLSGNQGNQWKLGFVNLISYLNEDHIIIRFIGVTGSGYASDISLDDIAVQSCHPPSWLKAENITDTGADLSWVENGTATLWDIEFGEEGFIPAGIPTEDSIVTQTYHFSGLKAGTCYQFYTRANCGNGNNSSWTGPANFCTTCPAIFSEYPYIQTFDPLTSFPPPCWTVTEYNENQNFNLFYFIDQGPVNLFAGVAPDTSDQNEWLQSPSFNLSSLDSPRLSFNWMVSDYSSMVTGDLGDVDLLISIDGRNTWNNNPLWNEDEEVFEDFRWYSCQIDLSEYNSQTNAAFAFQYTGNHAAYFFIDNFLISTCADSTAWTGDFNSYWYYPGNWDPAIPCESTRVFITDVSSGSQRYPAIMHGNVISECTITSPGSLLIMNRGSLYTTGGAGRKSATKGSSGKNGGKNQVNLLRVMK